MADDDLYSLRERAAFWELRARSLTAELEAAHERAKALGEAEARATQAERRVDRFHRFAMEIAEDLVGEEASRRPTFNARYIQDRAAELMGVGGA